MVNKAGRVGREGEHMTNGFLAAAGFLNVQREGRRKPSLDNVADGLNTPVETKRWASINLPQWVRPLFQRHLGRWALFIHPRDGRTRDGVPSLMVVPAAYGAHLLYLEAQLEAKAATTRRGNPKCGRLDCDENHTFDRT